MGVLDGQAVSASVTNPAFINKNQDDVMPNKLGFNRSLSGTSIADIQVAVNKLYTASGASETQTGTVYNATANTINDGDSYQTALTKLADKFDPATGHFHTGAAGDGPILDVVLTLAVTGNMPLTGNLVFIPGNGISMVQTGNDIIIAATGASVGGGGGGGSLQWIENANSPTPIFEDNIEVYGFDLGLGQSLYTNVKVPNTYIAGMPIRMRTECYSSAASGSLLFQTVTTLIRTGIDAISSTINQHTSTNSALTLGAGTVNIPQSVIADLSDGSGQINGVSVQSDDTLIVKLTRGTDTSTARARHMSFASEVTFS